MVYQNYRKHLKSNGDNVDALPFQQKIAMLTDIIENDESKCAIYFPQNTGKFLCFMSNEERRQKDGQLSQSTLEKYFAEHEQQWFDLAQPNEIQTEIIDDKWPHFPKFDFNFFCIKSVDCLNKGGYTIRKFHCMYHSCGIGNDADTSPPAEDSVERSAHLFVVYHYWFPHWPDHRSPENIDVVLDMCINLVDSDCEKELFNSHIDLSGDAATKVDGMPDSSRAPTSSNELQMDKSQSMPTLLNHVPFNGSIPVIHWLVYRFSCCYIQFFNFFFNNSKNV